MEEKTDMFSDLKTLPTIKKILAKNFPEKKPAEIDYLTVGLKNWFQKESNYKKVEKIAKNVCPKKKGGGKTRKRKRKRKKRTRRRHGGNGDGFVSFLGRMRPQDIGLMIMLGLGVWLLERITDQLESNRVREQNERMRRYRQQRRSRAPPPESEGTKETKEAYRPRTHLRALGGQIDSLPEGQTTTAEQKEELISEGHTTEGASTAFDNLAFRGVLDQDSDSE